MARGGHYADQGGFTWDPDEEKESRDPGDDRRCTPEALLEFVLTCRKLHRRGPTLYETKKRFGGILSAWIIYHDLKKAGKV